MLRKVLIANRGEVASRAMRSARRMGIAAAVAFALPLAAQAQPLRIESARIHSAALAQDRAINIYTPPGYATGGGRYPVLYLLDGGLKQAFPKIAYLVDGQIAAGKVAPLIVVGIASENREREFTSAEGAAALRRFLGDELRPWVKTHFRTAARSTLAGHSYGGLFAVDTLLREPRMFDDYVAVSPSMWVANYALVNAARPLLAAQPRAPHRLWLAIGNEGQAMGVDAFAKLLRRHAPSTLDWSLKAFPNDNHAAVALAAARVYVPALFPAA